MKRGRAILVALLSLVPLTAALALIPIPRLVSGINDPEHFLGAQQAAELNRKIAAYEQEKGISLVILIVRDIAPEKTARFGERVLALWRETAGARSKVVVMVVVAESKAAWIEENGTSLELSSAQRIVWETIEPMLKGGRDLASSIDAGVNQIVSVLDGTPLPPLPDETGTLHSIIDRLDTFRYERQGAPGSGPTREMLFLALAVVLGLGVRPFAGRWAAATLAALVGAFGSWLQYGFVVPNAAVAFVIVWFGWRHWFGQRDKSSPG